RPPHSFSCMRRPPAHPTPLPYTTLFRSLGKEGATGAEVEEAAKKAEIHRYIMSLPQKYDTVVGERGDTLSGGQRQRVAIARAILRDAPIIILDEATTGLDPKNSAEVFEAVDRLAAGRTTLVITHTLADALGCDEVVVLDRGRVVEHGRPADLMARAGSRLALLDPERHRRLAVVPDPDTPEEGHARRRLG